MEMETEKEVVTIDDLKLYCSLERSNIKLDFDESLTYKIETSESDEIHNVLAAVLYELTETQRLGQRRLTGFSVPQSITEGLRAYYGITRDTNRFSVFGVLISRYSDDRATGIRFEYNV